MAFTHLTDDLAIISKLSDEPNDVDGLTGAELKAKFDEAGLTIQTYINETLIPEIAGAGAAESVGISPVPGLTGAETVQDALTALVAVVQEAEQGEVLDGSITTSKLANAAVTTDKVAASAVTEAKLASAVVSTAKIADGAVTGAKIASGAVTADKIASLAVTADKIAAGAVTNGKLGALAVGTSNIDSYAVTAEKIYSGAVTDAKIAANAVSANFTATIGTTWTGSAAPYTQDVTVDGLRSTDTPIVDIVPSSTFATAEAQLEAYGAIFRMVAGTNTLTCYATEPTEVSIPIQIKAVRK